MSFTAFLDYYERAHRHPPIGTCITWRTPLRWRASCCSGVHTWAFHSSMRLSDLLGRSLRFRTNTPAFFEAAPVSGLRASVARKLQVALGGLAWSAACFLRLFGVGPLVQE